MQRRISFLTDDSGQTLIYVAISMFVLLGFVALAVDVGHVYAERRHMQNAADAGALEAARALCFGVNVSASDAAASGAAFMEANYGRPGTQSHGYTVVPNALNLWEFDATASEVTRLYFAGVVGVAPMQVQATARAACGSTEKACGLFPIAFDKGIWDKMIPDPNDPSSCENKTFYAWTSDNDKLNGNNDADEGPNCTTCDCDRVYIQNQLQPEAIAVADAGRAWLDFTSAIPDELRPDSCAGGNGCGANELKCWVDNDSKALFSLPKCVSGDSGVKLGVRSNVNGRVGDYVKLPLFDGRCTPDEGLRGTCKEGFNIVQFGCMQVQRWDNKPIELEWKITPTPPPQGNPNPGRCWKGQLMPVKIACDKCETECGSTTGGGDPGSGIKAVSLIK